MTAKGRIYPAKLPTASGNVSVGNVGDYVHVFGIVARESGGTNPVHVVLRAGGASGNVVAAFDCLAGVSTPAQWFGPQGIQVQAALYCAITGTGTLDGSVLIG